MAKQHKLMFVFGTRPEAIKLAPLILLAKTDPRFQTCLVSTGQHEEMLTPILSLFQLKADYELKVMRPEQDLATLNARISNEIVKPLTVERPDWTIVQGDTVTCAAAATSAFLLRCPVAHVEAGLRTHNLQAPWPEEFNRRLTALAADVHFAPTKEARDNLLNDKIEQSKIHITGNTGIDALILTLSLLKTRPDLREQVAQTLSRLNPKRQLVLVTVHRREAYGEPLKGILRSILKIVESRPGLEVILPVHKNPNVRRAVSEILGTQASWDGSGQQRIHLFEPLDYLTFLAVMERSSLILTDSGGVQEEAPSLQKPVLVLRETTERNEAVRAGCSLLVGFDEVKILKTALHLIDSAEARQQMFSQGNPFGDGKASQRILDILDQSVSRPVG